MPGHADASLVIHTDARRAGRRCQTRPVTVDLVSTDALVTALGIRMPKNPGTLLDGSDGALPFDADVVRAFPIASLDMPSRHLVPRRLATEADLTRFEQDLLTALDDAVSRQGFGDDRGTGCSDHPFD